MSERRTCETCRWWDKLAEGHVYANCRRLPPRPSWGVSIQSRDSYQNPDVSVYSRPNPEWPNTHQDDWGGPDMTNGKVLVPELEKRIAAIRALKEPTP